MVHSLHHQIVDSIADYAVFALDTDGRVLSWNPGAERLLGYRATEIIGRAYGAFYSGEDAEAGIPDQELAAATRSGHRASHGWRLRKDGTRLFADTTVSAMRDDERTLTGFAVVLRDRTEAHATEDALRQSEEKFRLLVQTVKDYAILMLDPEGRITSWNSGAEGIKGYRADEIIGQSFERFYPQEAVDSGFPKTELVLAARDGRFEDENWRIRKDGSRYWANVIITALRNDAGELIGFAKITRDLTERRRADEQARRLAAERAALAEAEARRQELEQLNAKLQAALATAEVERERAERSAAEAAAAYKELDQFAYVASHDLKAPLRGIANLAQWIQDDAAERLTDESAEHLRLLHGRVQRMEALIEGILAYSRAGRVRTEPEAVDTGELLTEVIELLAPPAEVAIELQRPMPLLHAERVPLQQVFMNLIGNAIKYGTGHRPDLTIHIEWRDCGQQTEFAIRDNGPGIAPQFHERVWGVFQTLAARDRVEGTGIGLSLVKKVVESRGGRVSLESAAGEGATFRFVWPNMSRQESTE